MHGQQNIKKKLDLLLLQSF